MNFQVRIRTLPRVGNILESGATSLCRLEMNDTHILFHVITGIICATPMDLHLEDKSPGCGWTGWVNDAKIMGNAFVVNLFFGQTLRAHRNCLPIYH